MSKLIYIGNQLQSKGLNPTTIDTLGDKLSSDLTIIRASKLSNPILRLLHMWLTILIHAKRSDKILIDTYSSTAFLFAWTTASLCKVLRLKYIPFLHGGNLPERYIRSNKRCASFFKYAYRVISPSNYLKAETEKKFNVKVTVIPNYIELENYPKSLKQVKKKVNLLWVRSFDQIYNPILAINAVNQINNFGYDVNLKMVGPDKDGTGELCKAKAKELGVEHKVNFTGRLTKKNWINLSEECNIFINTTNADNTPISVMEAMALGFPVVTTNVGGIPYLFENNKEGIMVPPDDLEAMVTAILKIANNANIAMELSKNARLKAEEWDWSVVKEQWIKLLSDE